MKVRVFMGGEHAGKRFEAGDVLDVPKEVAEAWLSATPKRAEKITASRRAS
jgi:hypothetical protein